MNDRFKRLLIVTLLLILLSKVSADKSKIEFEVGVGGRSDMVLNWWEMEEYRMECVDMGASLMHRTSYNLVFGMLADLQYCSSSKGSGTAYDYLFIFSGYDHRRYGAIKLGVDILLFPLPGIYLRLGSRNGPYLLAGFLNEIPFSTSGEIGIGFRMFRNLNMWIGTTEKFLFGAPLPIYTKIKLKISSNVCLNLKGRYNRPGSYGDRKPDWGLSWGFTFF